ncbi:unnamed protein product, partial [Timema podura]|nr:unnamed protein product [Timema podura]
MLKWTVGHRKTEGAKSPSGPCYSIRRALHLARRSRTPSRDKENKGHVTVSNTDTRHFQTYLTNVLTPPGSHRHSQCQSPRTRDSVYMCLEAIPAALRDVSNQHHTHGPTASNQYHTHGPTASNQYHTHGPTASKRCCSQGRRTRTAPRDYKHGDRETGSHLVSTTRRISLCDVDSKSTLISSTNLPPPGRSDVTSPSRLMQIDYSPCPMKTTKSLLALRRRLVDAFNQPSPSSVGTPHIAPQRSVDNPLYFIEPGKLKGRPPLVKLSLTRSGEGASRVTRVVSRRNRLMTTRPLYLLGSPPKGVIGVLPGALCITLPSSRITPPSPFLNSTHASSVSSTNQHDRLKACVPAIRDSRLKAFVPILEDAHDLTDPRFLSHLTFMEATVMPTKNSSIFHGFEKVRLSNGFRGSSVENKPVPTRSYLEFVDSGVDMTRSNDEYSFGSRRYSLRKRNSTRRVRTVTSTSEDGPPIKVQSVGSEIGLSVIPFSSEMTSLDASRSCHTPANSEYCQKILRHRKSFRSSARRSRRNSLKGIGDGVFKRENIICDSIFNECGRNDLYNLNSSGDSLDRSFSLRRQGGFRRKNRGFVTGEAARSCTDVTTACQMTKHSLLSLPLNIPSPFSAQSEGGTLSIPGITNTTFTVQGSDRGSPEPGKLDQPSSRDKGSSLTLPKGIPSPPSPTCHSVELTSPTGMDGISPLATSPGPQGVMERTVALWKGANPVTNFWRRNERRMNGLKDGNMSTSSSDETWNSHTMNALRTPVLTSGHILRSSGTTTSTDRQEGRGESNILFYSPAGILHLQDK